jgi:uncharacterized protein
MVWYLLAECCIGVVIFAEGFPLWQNFYEAEFMGAPLLSEILGASRGVLTFLIILVALGMFWVGEWAEKKFARDDYLKND